jgi:predicted enzyme related to lactoylglutathione lyase
MHRSRVYALIIDTPRAEADEAAAFWSAALGAEARPLPDEPQFTSLHGALPTLVAAVQAVDDTPRYHIDIETDDVEAETARLVGLGATVLRRHTTGEDRWVVLADPEGNEFCVVRAG